MDRIRIAETVTAIIIAINVQTIIGYTGNKFSYYWNEYCKYKFIRMERQKLILEYPTYFGTIGSEKLSLSGIGESLYSNNLILFHGKTNMMYLDNLLKYKISNTYFIDKDQNIEPDIVADLSVSNSLDMIPDKSMERIVVFYCSCHIQSFFRSLIPEIRKKLTDDGNLYIVKNTNVPFCLEFDSILEKDGLHYQKSTKQGNNLPGFGSIVYNNFANNTQTSYISYNIPKDVLIYSFEVRESVRDVDKDKKKDENKHDDEKNKDIKEGKDEEDDNIKLNL